MRSTAARAAPSGADPDIFAHGRQCRWQLATSHAPPRKKIPAQSDAVKCPRILRAASLCAWERKASARCRGVLEFYAAQQPVSSTVPRSTANCRCRRRSGDHAWRSLSCCSATVFCAVDDSASVAAQQSTCARTEDAFQSTAFILDWYETRQDPSVCFLPQLLEDLAAMQDAIKPWKLRNVSVANLYFPCPASPIAQSRVLGRMCIVATGTKWLRSG